MSLARGIAAAVAIALAASSSHAGDRLVEATDHRGSIDWTRGLVMEVGAAPGDIRAPSAAVARVGAERRARKVARARLAARALTLPLANGRTVAVLVENDAAMRARLDRAIERALDVTVSYSSDGSTTLTAGLPIEAIRLAIAGAPAPPVGRPDAPTAILVDATATKILPAVGWVVRLGAETYAGPVVFHRTVQTAEADARIGGRPVRARAVAASAGVLALTSGDGTFDAATLSAAHKAGALVVLVVGEQNR